jgi:hypothetical protein
LSLSLGLNNFAKVAQFHDDKEDHSFTDLSKLLGGKKDRNIDSENRYLDLAPNFYACKMASAREAL